MQTKNSRVTRTVLVTIAVIQIVTATITVTYTMTVILLGNTVNDTIDTQTMRGQ